MGGHRTNGPIGLDAADLVTRAGCRTVLVPVPHVVAGTRLLDLLPLVETDPRAQVLFTVEGADHGTEEFVRALDGHVLPWDQAVRHEFDLVLAASFRGVDRLRGPVLVVPHGAGALKSRPRRRDAPPAHGLVREHLVRDGRVAPSALVLSHRDELDVLRESCPEAVDVAVVAGDVCPDRMRASLPHRERYREALGVAPGRRLVTVCSTWTPHSVFGGHIGLYRALVDAGHRVAAVLHPNTWSVHGARQVRAWLPAEVLAVPPEEGWRAAVVAADVVVGDFGPCTQYAAALGAPLLVVPLADGLLRESGPADLLHRRAPLITPARPVLDAAAPVPGVAEAISSCHDEAATIPRRTMYRLLDLPRAAGAVPPSPPTPLALGRAGTAGRDRRTARRPVGGQDLLHQVTEHRRHLVRRFTSGGRGGVHAGRLDLDEAGSVGRQPAQPPTAGDHRGRPRRRGQQRSDLGHRHGVVQQHRHRPLRGQRAEHRLSSQQAGRDFVGRTPRSRKHSSTSSGVTGPSDACAPRST